MSICCGLSEDGRALIHSLSSLPFKISTKHTKRNKPVKVNRKEKQEEETSNMETKGKLKNIDKYSNEGNGSSE